MDWLKALQATPGQNLQDALWSLATPDYWLAMGGIAGIGAFAIFIWLMIEVAKRRRLNDMLPPYQRKSPFDAVLIGRLGWMLALILAIPVRLNSGLLIASFSTFVVTGTFMGLLSATNWCGRRGSAAFKIGQILGEVAGYIRRPESTPIRHR